MRSSKSLLEAEAFGVQGQRPLHKAAYKGFVDMVIVLLEANAQRDAQTADGMTALMCASINGHVEVVRQMLIQGANPYLADSRCVFFTFLIIRYLS